MKREADIAVTGAGLVTCLGASVGETWDAILAGRAGLGPMPALEQRPNPDKGGGQAVDITHEIGVPRAAAYLRAAIRQALDEARPSEQSTLAAVMGTTLHGMRAGGTYTRSGDPLELRTFLAGPILDLALDGLPVAGPRLTTCAACASGLNSILLGVSLLRAGVADVVIAGGYDSVSEYAYAGFDSLRLIAEGRPRPFAQHRDGMKVAEGYGIVVLERAHDAARRGAAMLALVAGGGETADAYHLTQPHPDGLGAAAALRAALADAGLGPSDIGLIAAHATATPNNDAAEYAGLAAVFGASLSGIPVVGFKSHLGHTLGAAGAVELILAMRAMAAGLAPPTAGDDTIDPAFSELRLIRGKPHPARINAAVGLSLGFGGSNTAVVVRDPGQSPALRESRGGDTAVITGIGPVLPGAIGVEAFAALLAAPPARPRADTGPIAESDVAHLINARRTRRMSEYSKLTLAATAAAIQHAGLTADAERLAAASAILGTSHGSSPFCEQYYAQLVAEGINAANPVLFAEGVPNAAAAHLSMTFGVRGGCQTIIGTPTAGLDALALAALRIEQGRSDTVIVSAAEEYSPVVNRAYAACAGADGSGTLVTGSAAITLILESRAAATARGAAILGEVSGVRWSRGERGTADDGVPFLPELFSVTPLAEVAAAALSGASAESADVPGASAITAGSKTSAVSIVVRSLRGAFPAAAAEATRD